MIGHFKLKNGFILLFLSCIWSTAQAQSGTRYAFVNMEYIFSCIPDYAKAQQELDDYSQKLQADIDAVYAEIAEMQSRYNADKVFLTDEQVKKREAEIVAKEKETTELRFKYFGPEGELYQKRQSLLKPIQDDVYNAVKKVAEERGYQAIFDRASSSDIVYASPRIDISNEVLAKLGYSN